MNQVYRQGRRPLIVPPVNPNLPVIVNKSKTGLINSANSIIQIENIGDFGTVSISITGRYTGVTFIVEASDDGSNWYGPQAYLYDTGASYNGSTNIIPGDNTSVIFFCNLIGAIQFRVRATGWSSGAAQVRITPIKYTYSKPIALNVTTPGGSVPVVVAVDGTVQNAQISITNSATQLTSIGAHKFIIKNDDASANDVFIGSSTVTTSNGYRIKPGQSITVDIKNSNIFWGITAAGTGTLSIIGLSQ